MNINTSQLGDNIDIKKSIKTIFRNYKILLIITTAFLIFGLLFNFVWPTEYEAKSIIVISKPSFSFSFDPKIEMLIENIPHYQAIPELATSDNILVPLYQDQDFDKDTISFSDFASNLTAEMKSEEFLILTTTWNNPQIATKIANQWSEKLIETLNSFYNTDAIALQKFQEQADQSLVDWNNAEKEYLEFLQNTQIEALVVEKEQKRIHLSESLFKKDSILIIIQEIDILQHKLEQYELTNPLSQADSLSLLLIQQKIFEIVPTFEFRVDANFSTYQTVGEGLKSLLFLKKSLTEGQSTYLTLSDNFSNDLKELVLKVEELENEKNRLLANRDLAQQAYVSLSTQVEELSISILQNDLIAKVILKSVSNPDPMKLNPAFTLIIAGALGIIIGALFILVMEWWEPSTNREN